MSEAATNLEQLKQQAESQMRRAAPPLPGKDPKKRKVDQDEEVEEGTVGRFSYAADAAIAAGSTCLMASCGFNRSVACHMMQCRCSTAILACVQRC